MKKLVAGAYSPSMSLHVYEYENGILKDAKGEYVSLKTYYSIINTLIECEGQDIHYLIRQADDEWFCEYVVRMFPQTEAYVIGYGDGPEEALANCLARVVNPTE